jgi:hypothetical protein
MATPTLERPAKQIKVTIEATTVILAVNEQDAEEQVKAALEREGIGSYFVYANEVID